MNLFEPKAVWLDEYSIGIAVLDVQHQQLFKLLDKVHALVHLEPVQALKAFPDILDRLNEYVAYHLMTEETLMKKHLPADEDMVAHMTAHRIYWQRIVEFKERLARHDIEVVAALVAFLDHWWSDHVLGRDRVLGERLREKGLR